MTIRRLLIDRTAASAAEFALVLPLLLIFLFGIIDAGRLMWTMNRAEKATQMAVRYAVVTDMVPEDLLTKDFTDEGIPGGDPVPTSEFSSTTCDDSGCDPDWGYDSDAFDRIVQRIQYFAPEVGPEDVQITYENIGLGFSGSPEITDDDGDILYYSPDVAPLVTIRLTGQTFQPITLMAFGASFGLPDFRAALTVEDGSGTVSN